MSERVTLEIPDALARNAREIATQTHRRVEDVLVEWLIHAATDLPVEQLPDDQVLALRDMQMDDVQQAALGELLARQREGVLTEAEHVQLDDLMRIYRHGMVRKAEALKVAVERGLQPPLS